MLHGLIQASAGSASIRGCSFFVHDGGIAAFVAGLLFDAVVAATSCDDEAFSSWYHLCPGTEDSGSPAYLVFS